MPASLAGLRVGLFPYGTGGNPYQRMIAEALAAAGYSPQPLPKHNWFALRWTMSQSIDVLQIHWPHSLYHGRNTLTTIMKRWMYADGLRCLERKPVMYSADNLFPHDATNENFEKAMIQRLVDCVDGILVASSSAGSIFCKTYRLPKGVECAVVPHRNYLEAYPNQVSPTDARSRLQIAREVKVILFLGRLLWYKGLDRLVSAFLSVDASDACLILAGTPPATGFVSELERQVALRRGSCSGRVRVDARYIPDEEIQLYMNAADVVALPYADMPMNPGTLILAMGFGKPVISPDKGSTREIVGETLFGYDERDPVGLSGAIQRALNAGDLADRGREALSRVLANHSLPRVAAAYLEAYERLAARLNK